MIRNGKWWNCLVTGLLIFGASGMITSQAHAQAQAQTSGIDARNGDILFPAGDQFLASDSEDEVRFDRKAQSGTDLILPGLVAGALGFALGATAGYGIEKATCGEHDDLCGFRGAVIGGVIGGSVGTSLGVHLANDRRGQLPITAVAATAAGLLGLWAWSAAESDGARLAWTVAIPLGQVGSAVLVERAMTR